MHPLMAHKNITDKKGGLKDTHLFFLFFLKVVLLSAGCQIWAVINVSACVRLYAATTQE